MIPDNRLLNIHRLYSGRGQTFYTPETLFLSIGIDQPKHAEDSAIATLIHESIHWRQFQGTTFGAFCQWLKHSQEVDTYRDLGELRQAANEGREPDVAPMSNVWPRDTFEPELFRTAARQTLESSYGYALWEFFAAAALSPDRPESWATALAVIDFALNGPLPPHVLPGQRQPEWWDLYPPARFLRASAAVPRCRRIGFLPKPHRFPMFFDSFRCGIWSKPNPQGFTTPR